MRSIPIYVSSLFTLDARGPNLLHAVCAVRESAGNKGFGRVIVRDLLQDILRPPQDSLPTSQQVEYVCAWVSRCGMPFTHQKQRKQETCEGETAEGERARSKRRVRKRIGVTLMNASIGRICLHRPQSNRRAAHRESLQSITTMCGGGSLRSCGYR